MIIGLEQFVVESWKIEGLAIGGSELAKLVDFHERFIDDEDVSVESLSEAALLFTGGRGQLRSRKGMDVRVGNHRPPRGGKQLADDLEEICECAEMWSAYVLHQRFEQLHPFIDGNGRTGRLLWAWRMERESERWRQIGFLHSWYYQSLQDWSEWRP